MTTLAILLPLLISLRADPLFEARFDHPLDPGWSWIRENPGAWRLSDGVLMIKIEPGNMWGPENSGRNVLVRDLPDKEALHVSMLAENRPTGQYEQVDLVAYFDDSHMVKIGEELVDGQLSVVMGREEKDRTHTLAIIPLATPKVELRLELRGRRITGSFRPNGSGEWRTAGQCDLPGPGRPRIAIQCYQGLKDQEHWARISSFKIKELAAGTGDTTP